MIATRRAILSVPVGVLFLAAAAPPTAVLAADVGSVEIVEVEAGEGSFPEHGACAYFGADREKYLGAGMAGDWSRMKQRAALTDNVMRAIGLTRSPGPRTRGDLFRIANAPPPTGPCNGIDECIQRKAAAAGVPPAELTTDAEFLRRVTLDLTGRIPTPQEITAFLSDASPDKRAQAVERLLATPQWADRWALFFGDLFKNTRLTAQVNRYPNGRDSFHLFLLESLRQNKSYDRMAREMIAAVGFSDGRNYPTGNINGRSYPETYSSFAHFQRVYNDYVGNPVKASPVGYIVGGRTTGGPVQDTYDSLAFFTARDFLGLGQMDCVLCHDGAGHLDALSVWGAAAKRLEGWQMAAFFSDIQRYQLWRVRARTLPTNPANGRRANANYYYIADLPPGSRQQARQNGQLVDLAGDYLGQTEGGNRPDRLHNSRFVAPDYPFASNAKGTVSPSLSLREQYGLYLTADPQFARAIVNYIWKEFFSRGIVEPADQFDLARLDPANPPTGAWDIQPSHPELLEWLAAGFRENGHDLKWLMREIATSRTYQLSSRYDGAFNPTHERYFVRHNVKRLPAEQIHDAIVAAGGIPVTYRVSRTIPSVNFAVQFSDVDAVPQGRNANAFQARTFLDAFLRGDRDGTPRSRVGSPLQALQLMNSQLVSRRVRSNAGALSALLDQPDDALVTSLYLRVLSRMPSDEELSFGVQTLGQGPRAAQASNLMWAMFNKTDFYFNY